MTMENRSEYFDSVTSELTNNASVSISVHLDGWPAAVSCIGVIAILSTVYLLTHKPSILPAA